MNGKDLLAAMGYLEDERIEELFLQARRDIKPRRRYLKGAGVVAACICIAITGVFLYGRSGEVFPEKDIVHVKMSAVAVNEISGFDSDEKINRINLPNNCVEELWDKNDIEEYFGRNLQPAYLPKGLKPSPHNDKKTVFLLNGKPYLDAVSLDFYHAFSADGMPLWTEDAAAEKGFTLTAWKMGFARDYMWTSEEERLETSIIGDTEVTFGYRAMEYGPYDEKTHAPAGTYDLYAVTFQLDGVHYEIVSHQLPFEEVLKVVTSFICETDRVMVE